jgi:hypothetical protein
MDELDFKPVKLTVKKIRPNRIADASMWLQMNIDPEGVAVTSEAQAYADRTPASLREAAKMFGLDLNDEVHQRLLLRVLAELMFGKGEKGRPRNTLEWPQPRLSALGERYCELLRRKPGTKLLGAARAIKTKYPNDYGDLEEQYLRQLLPTAKSAYEHDERMWEEHQRDMQEYERYMQEHEQGDRKDDEVQK